MSLKDRNLISTLDFSVEEQDEIFSLAAEMIDNPQRFSTLLNGKILASLFFEPSTRTRLSFEAAMLRLGGRVIGFSEQNSSSVSKGESISDTIRTVCSYSDIIVMRHPKEGTPLVAANNSSIPIINAGDGGREHPTQTLTDLLTIKSIKSSIQNLTIGCCGDLKFGRTVHSLVKNIGRYENIQFIFVSPPELQIPEYLKSHLEQNKIEYKTMYVLEEAIKKMDVLYMTRVQRERFFNEEDYIRLKDTYILDKKKLSLAKEHLTVLHPLPRVNEISYDVDNDPRSCYFEQAKYGMYVRMALMSKLLGAV